MACAFGCGIVGNLMGYPLLDPVGALIVEAMVLKMGWQFGWEALHDLMASPPMTRKWPRSAPPLRPPGSVRLP